MLQKLVLAIAILALAFGMAPSLASAAPDEQYRGDRGWTHYPTPYGRSYGYGYRAGYLGAAYPYPLTATYYYNPVSYGYGYGGWVADARLAAYDAYLCGAGLVPC